MRPDRKTPRRKAPRRKAPRRKTPDRKTSRKTRARTGILCVHSSNEMYGADRVLLQVVQAVPPDRRQDVVVWLPPAPEAGPQAQQDGPVQGRLARELQRLGIRHSQRSLPILRRRLVSARGVLTLAAQLVSVLPALIRLRPQVLYCSTSAVLLLAPAARLLGVPRVVLHVQEIWSGPEAAVLRVMSRFATDWIAISRASAASLPTGIVDRVQVIPNGVEDRGPRPAGAAVGRPAAGGTAGSEPGRTPPGNLAEVQPPAGSESEPLRFLMAGRWNAWKGHEFLLRAWDAGDPPGILTILGGPPETGTGVDVAGLVAALRHPESVDIVGEVPEITGYVDAADVMVVPSTAPEPFGLVAIEAFARCRPVVGSNAGGLADVVTQGVTGWLYDPGDLAGLSAVLRRLDRPTARVVGKLARRAYEEQYTATLFRENLGAWWKQVVES